MKAITMFSAAVLSGALAVSATTTAEAATAATSAQATGTATVSAQSSGVLTGSCKLPLWGNFGRFKAYYNIDKNVKGFYHFDWFIGGPGLRNKNNVRIRLREDHPFGDWTSFTWYSKDNVAPGSGSFTPGRPLTGEAPPPGRHKVHVDVRFTFDRPRHDPNCTAVSGSV